MIWRIISASVVVFIVTDFYLTWSLGANDVLSYISNTQWGVLTLNGVSVAQFASNAYALFGAAIVTILVFTGLYLFAGAHADESDQGEVVLQ